MLKSILAVYLLLFVLVTDFSSQDRFHFSGKIAYTHQGGELHILDLNTGTEQKFVRRGSDDLMIRPDWHPDGVKIVADTELMILDTQLDQRKVIRDDGLFASWHPAGEQIIYTVRSEGIGIWDVNTETETIIRLPITPLDPEWHPERHEIIFTGRNKDNYQEQIYTLSLNCIDNNNCHSKLVQIPSEVERRDPSWNSTGEYILLSERTSVAVYRTLIIDNSGNFIRQVGDRTAINSLRPKWGPCDRFIVLSERHEDSPSHIYIVDLMTNEIIQPTQEIGGAPDWWWDENDIDCEPFDLEQGATS